MKNEGEQSGGFSWVDFVADRIVGMMAGVVVGVAVVVGIVFYTEYEASAWVYVVGFLGSVLVCGLLGRPMMWVARKVVMLAENF